MDRMREQSINCGAVIHTETVEKMDLSARPFKIVTGERTVMAKSVIVATGATAKRMEIPGTRDDEFWNRGVSACGKYFKVVLRVGEH